MRWVIVAHPDDEVIFAGGAILARRDEAWTVVCATHAEDSPRAVEALGARDRLRAHGVRVDYRFLGFPDEPHHPEGGIGRQAMAEGLSMLGVARGERVYTHGAPGEYGHVAHRTVHAAVVEALAATAEVSVFSGGGTVLERVIDPSLLAAKIHLFNTAYPSQAGVWRGLPRTMIEVTSEERHYALCPSPADAGGVGERCAPSVPPPLGHADSGVLGAAVDAQLRRLGGGLRDALIVGLGPALDLERVWSRVSGRLDVAGPFHDRSPDDIRGQGVQLVADDFARWTPPGEAYDLILCLEVLQRVADFEAVFRFAESALRPKGQIIFTHEPLIEGHPDHGRAHLLVDEPLYRRPTQTVLDLARRHGMKLRLVQDLVTGHRLGEPVISQLVRLERR